MRPTFQGPRYVVGAKIYTCVFSWKFGVGVLTLRAPRPPDSGPPACTAPVMPTSICVPMDLNVSICPLKNPARHP